MWLPGVAITELSGEEALAALDAALAPLLHAPAPGGAPDYTHVAFTSKNGIYSTVARLAVLAGGVDQAVDALVRSGTRLCALGADGAVLTSLGLPLHVSPLEASTQGLVQELVAHGEARGARVLCPVPAVLGGLTEPSVVPRFLHALADAGAASVVRANAYETRPGCGPEDAVVEAAALSSGAVSAIAFSSTAEAQGLLAALGGRHVLADAVVHHGVVLAAHGPYTAAGTSDVLGLPVECVSADFRTFDGLVAAVEGAVRRR